MSDDSICIHVHVHELENVHCNGRVCFPNKGLDKQNNKYMI